ncbi:hypothetical protein ABVQ18_17595 [Snodgrassella alvi]|uniref:hypothetical protein n=1 Tax=Snodgrassella alvi TaxID=1196083 RepID=UPI00351200B1
MQILKSVLLITTIFTLANTALAASHQTTDESYINDDAERIMSQMLHQQQQIEKEIENLSASIQQDENQVKLFKNCKQPECHQYSETTSFRLEPNHQFTYQNQVSKDNRSKSISRSGRLIQNKNNQTLILDNAAGQPEIYLNQ